MNSLNLRRSGQQPIPTCCAMIALAVGCLMLLSGCASEMETANKGANDVGQTTGGAMRVPNSFSEGAAKGVAGPPTANPYNR